MCEFEVEREKNMGRNDTVDPRDPNVISAANAVLLVIAVIAPNAQ
jgi:hypothetical protein